MARNKQKVLVISHNVFSATTNMGLTMSNFFKDWDQKNLAQLYFHSEIPTSTLCNNYFRITDMEMIKKTKPGNQIREQDISIQANSTRTDSGMTANLYKIGRKRKPYMYFLRNLIWTSNKWETKELIDWIDNFNPEIIFYAAGDYVFSMNIAIRISELKNIPLVVYFGDDYYYYNQYKYSLINKYNKKEYNKVFRKLFEKLDTFIAASDKMNNAYTAEFDKPGYTIMNSTQITDNIKKNKDIKISYVGNLGLDRWQSLVDIGNSIKDKGILIDVYSLENRQDILSHMTAENGINFHGALDSEGVKKVIESSTVVIHVESLKKTNRERTKYSVSTKIGGYLGSGVCIFAYGPSDVASMEYLSENRAAKVTTNKDELKTDLLEVLFNDNERELYVNNALKLASERHSFERNSEIFDGVLGKVK